MAALLMKTKSFKEIQNEIAVTRKEVAKVRVGVDIFKFFVKFVAISMILCRHVNFDRTRLFWSSARFSLFFCRF